MVGGTKGRWIAPLDRALSAAVLSWFVGQDMGMFMAHMDKDDLGVLRDLMQSGKVTPAIDRTYTLSQVPEAIRYLEAGHARGKVVITVGSRSAATSIPNLKEENPMRTMLRTLLICLLAPAALALAQESKPAAAAPAPGSSTHRAFNKMAYGFVKANLLRSAEKMPEENYGFKPADTVRSFGQIVGHVADSSYYLLFRRARREEPRPEDRADQDLEGRSRGLAQGRLRLLRQGLRRHDRRVRLLRR